MDTKRRPVRRGQPQEIARIAKYLGDIGVRQVQRRVLKNAVDTFIQSPILQKLFAGKIDEIKIRDLRKPVITYEEVIEGLDIGGILKRIAPRTTRQIIDELDETKFQGDEKKDLIVYRNELKERLEETKNQALQQEIQDRIDVINGELVEEGLIGNFRIVSGEIETIRLAEEQDFKQYPQLNNGNVEINLLTEQEQKEIERIDNDDLNEAVEDLNERMADYLLRQVRTEGQGLEQVIEDLRREEREDIKEDIKDTMIRGAGMFSLYALAPYLPYVGFLREFPKTSGGLASLGVLGGLFYNYYTSQPGSKIPAPIEERGHAFNKDHNFNGPGTRVESRIELDKRTQGKFPFIFPSGVLDLIALEHDLLYTTPNAEIQQLADLKYVENVRNPKKFLLSLNERTGKELFNSKDINSIVKEFQKNKINYVSAGFIQGQATSRTIDNPIKLRKIIKDISKPSEDLIELLRPGEIKRRYGVDVSKLFKKKVPDEYVKYMKDAEKSVNSVLSLMADGGRLNNKGVYVPSKKYNKKTFTEDLQKVHDNFNELVLEQRKVDKEELENIERYRKVKLDPLKVDTFINDFNKIVEDPIIEVDVPVIKENDKIIFVNNIQNKMVVQEALKDEHYDSLYSYVPQTNAKDRQIELERLWVEGQKLVPSNKKDLKAPRYSSNKRGVSLAQFERAYLSLQKQLKQRSVSRKEIRDLDTRHDERAMNNIKQIYDKASPKMKNEMNKNMMKETQGDTQAFQRDRFPPTEKTRERMDTGLKKPLRGTALEGLGEFGLTDIGKRLGLIGEDPPTLEPLTSEDVDKPLTQRQRAIQREKEVADAPFYLRDVIPQREEDPRKEIPEEGTPFKGSGSANKENPDNLVQVRRPTKKSVDKVLNPTSAEKRRMNAGFYDFLTPDDQTGGIGTAQTNPLIRRNEQHEKKMAKGNLSMYRNNTILGNKNNLLQEKTYNIKEIKRDMKQRRGMPKKVRGLIRKYPAYMPPQRQSRLERNDLQMSVNPPSNYYKGSMYKPFFRSIAEPLPYDEYVRRFYANPNQFHDGADFYNRRSNRRY